MPIIQYFTAVKYGYFQMKICDIVLFSLQNIDREFTYLNILFVSDLAGVPKKVFLAVVAGNVTTLDGIFTHSAPGLN